MSRPRIARRLLAALCALLLGPAGSAAAPPAEAHERLRRGHAALEEFDYDGAIAAFDGLVRAFQAGSLNASDPTARPVLLEALVGRATAHLGAGDDDAASNDLAMLLSTDPGFELSSEVHSPVLVELFEKTRRATIGYLAVRTEPPGCGLWIDGEHVGETPLEVPWIAGPVSVRLEHAGFAPVSLEAELAAGAMILLQKTLTASGREVRFLTSPPGVSIVIDGKVRATTEGEASEEVARRYGFPPGALSAATSAGYLPQGKNRVILERPCHLPEAVEVDVVVDATNHRPLLVPPVSLRRTVSGLRLRSRPPGATVRIDGVEVGRTPLDLDEVCAGERRVELTGTPRGKWVGDLTLAPDELRELEVSLRPTVMFLGLATGEGGSQRARQESEKVLLEELGRLDSYQPLQVQAGAERTAVLLASGDGPQARAAIAEVLATLDGDLVIVGQVAATANGQGLEMLLYSVHQEQVERFRCDAGDLAAAREFVQGLDRPTPRWSPSIGLRAIDTRGEEAPLVVEIGTDGGAGAAGVRPGDRLFAVGDRTISSALDIHPALLAALPEGAAPGAVVPLHLRRGEEEIVVEVSVGVTPVVLWPGEPGRYYNKALVDLDYAARGGEPSELGQAVARLGAAVAFLHFDRCDRALELLSRGPRLPAGPGISAGTADYVAGLCHERMGTAGESEARDAFAAAAASNATLGTDAGPRVAPLARAHLDALSTGSVDGR